MHDDLTPPRAAHALIAAASPPSDYEVVAGDLHEEYARIARYAGMAAANRWYWSQALRSVPGLLSYSRAPRSFGANAFAGFMVLVVICAMLFVKDLIDRGIDAAHLTALPAWIYLCFDWLDAAFFGAVLAFLVRSQGVRLAVWAASALVAAIVIPTLFGFSSRLPVYAWVLIFGVVPAMGLGAGIYQIGHRHRKD